MQERLFAEEPTYSVPELNGAIGAVLNRAFPDEIWVRGEIANLSRPSSGHVYFDLVDGGCSLPVTLWASDCQVVNGILKRAGGAVRITDGTDVRLRARVSWWPERGRVSLRMLSIDTAYTLGKLAEERELLLRRLEAEGLLARQRALPLADVPLRVALVTSDGSAAAHDFLRTLEASGHGWHVSVVDTRVQGVDAERSIVAALRSAATCDPAVDVICLVRGGGARTDLAAFDREAVARTISALPVPVLTGIGHEIDTTVADAVAHRRCLTPTACAIALVEHVTRWCDRLDATWLAIGRAAEQELRHGEATLDRHEQTLRTRPARVLDRAAQLVDTYATRAHALDPARTLARGWSITRDNGGRLVRSVEDVPAGASITTSVADGDIHSTVRDG